MKQIACLGFLLVYTLLQWQSMGVYFSCIEKGDDDREVLCIDKNKKALLHHPLKQYREVLCINENKKEESKYDYNGEHYLSVIFLTTISPKKLKGGVQKVNSKERKMIEDVQEGSYMTFRQQIVKESISTYYSLFKKSIRFKPQFPPPKYC